MKSKKIGIITIHTDFNYGAVLQAIATQKLFEINGYDAEIIDYRNKFIDQQSKIIYKQDNKMKGYFITLIRNTVFGRYFYFKKAIRGLDKYRKKSSQRYYTINDLNNTEYDILIVGSDQLWNPVISNGIDPVFLLNFGKPKKKISLATSMGSYNLTEHDSEVFKEYLKDFNSISVREKHAIEQLQPLVSKKIKELLDPTLLLEKNVWLEEYAKDSKYFKTEEKYILTYFVGGEKYKYKSKVAEYSKELGLPVWSIQYSNYNWKETDKKILGASVIDFIALIKNASLVLTDSFHGVAFSVNLGIDFVSLTNVQNPIRVKEFLSKLDLDDRIDMNSDDYHEVDYSKVNDRLLSLREDSVEWIFNSIK